MRFISKTLPQFQLLFKKFTSNKRHFMHEKKIAIHTPIQSAYGGESVSAMYFKTHLNH